MKRARVPALLTVLTGEFDTQPAAFAYLLQELPGCYLIIGAASVSENEDPLKGKNIQEVSDQEHFVFKNACLLHQPDYDFNDDIIPLGATVFVRLAERYLSADNIK